MMVIRIGIKLTEEEKQLVKEGKLDPSKITEHREANPVHTVDKDELEKVKQEIRETNMLYKQSIEKNKELYEELTANRKRKKEFRNKITELRTQKKRLLGIE
ncbi:MAG: hypothetical protein ACE5DM_00285 [Candidatus Nanoarchaeia archaeon]